MKPDPECLGSRCGDTVLLQLDNAFLVLHVFAVITVKNGCSLFFSCYMKSIGRLNLKKEVLLLLNTF